MKLFLFCLSLQAITTFWFVNVSYAQETEDAPVEEKAASVQEFKLQPFEEEDYDYDPTGKRDPFRPFIKVVKPIDPVTKTTKIVNKKKVEEVVTDPLLKFELNEYTVIGILSNTENPRALIQAEGKTYVLYKNMRLGRNKGVIRDIREGELVVAEQVEIDGKVRQESKLLQIKYTENK